MWLMLFQFCDIGVTLEDAVFQIGPASENSGT